MIHHRVPYFALERLGVLLAVIALFVASQVFWIRRIGGLLRRWVKAPAVRRILGSGLFAWYLFLLWDYLGHWGGASSATEMTWKAALLDAPFGCWLFGSFTGYIIIQLLMIPGRLIRPGRRLVRRVAGLAEPAWRDGPATTGHSSVAANDAPSVSGRRKFMERAALTLGSAPFAVGAYGLLLGRLNLKITETPVRMARLPREFDGFRILQLSDLHIGPFMTASEIRRYVGIANHLHADLITLTGDYVTWDPSTQYAVVDALSGLKAPYGVVGCLGNHEIYTHTEDSITRLFAARGVRILRQEAIPVRSHGESINLIGVDFQTHMAFGHQGKAFVRRYLEGVESLLRPDTANILMSHNPNTFDRAAELQIDLSLAGHTHGGQVTLEFISKDINPARLITPYVRGWFEKAGGKLYVNSGIGTIGLPIRFDAPPEITVYKLTSPA